MSITVTSQILCWVIEVLIYLQTDKCDIYLLSQLNAAYRCILCTRVNVGFLCFLYPTNYMGQNMNHTNKNLWQLEFICTVFMSFGIDSFSFQITYFDIESALYQHFSTWFQLLNLYLHYWFFICAINCYFIFWVGQMGLCMTEKFVCSSLVWIGWRFMCLCDKN